MLSDGELVDAVAGFERMAAFMMARQAEVLAEFARRRPAEDLESARPDTACEASPYVADEIGLALHLARGTAAARIAQAQRLDGELRATRRAWREGDLDATRVRVSGRPPAALADFAGWGCALSQSGLSAACDRFRAGLPDRVRW